MAVIAFSYEYFAAARVGARGVRAMKTDKLIVLVHFTVNESFAHLVRRVIMVPAWTNYWRVCCLRPIYVRIRWSLCWPSRRGRGRGGGVLISDSLQYVTNMLP